MSYDNRAEQVAASIRDKILSRELTDPLPASRVWCRELDVGRPTLLAALKILEHAGLLRMTARGAKIARGRKKSKPDAMAKPRSLPVKSQAVRPHWKARFLYYGRNYKEIQQGSKWFLALSWALQRHDIRLVLERCNAVRLTAVATNTASHDELCFLQSLPAPYQSLFVQHSKPAVIVGYAGPDIALPYLTTDLSSSTRHAALRLLRRGFRRLVLINLAAREEGVTRSIESFQSACADWPHQPVSTEVVRVWNDLESQRNAIRRLAARTKEPCGFIIFSPVSVGMLVSALLERGISIPKEAEIVALEYTHGEISFSAPVTLYEFPAQRFAKAISTICLHYFETGALPPAGKTVELDPPQEL